MPLTGLIGHFGIEDSRLRTPKACRPQRTVSAQNAALKFARNRTIPD